jgi:hypothetical protein
MVAQSSRRGLAQAGTARPPRLVGVDHETLRVWSERGLTAMSPETAESLRASNTTANLVLNDLRTPLRSDDEGYHLRGPMPSADDE